MRPEILSLVALVVGFVVARAASAATAAVLKVLGRRAAVLATTEDGPITPRLISIVSAIVFWLLLASAFVIALRLLDVEAIETLLEAAIGIIPSILVAVAVVIAGHLAGLLVRQLLVRLFGERAHDSLLPRLAYLTIVAVALVMALQQVGIDISFITQLLLITVAIVGGGFMLVFALGARQHVENLLARRELERLAVGDRVEIGDVRGRIVAIHSTTVEVATANGTAAVPAARFAKDVVTKLPADEQDD